MMEKKKRNPLVIIIVLLFIIFASLYFTQLTDLYQYKEYNKMSITKEAMERFESDVESGKNIQIEDYIETVQDYTNGVSKLGNKTSKFVENIMTNGLKRTFKVITTLFS